MAQKSMTMGGGARVSKFWAKKSELRILVTGKRGQGKSTLINGILGVKVALEGAGASKGCTTGVEMYFKDINEVPVRVFVSSDLQDRIMVQNEEKYIKGMRDKCKELSLVIYCTKMTNTRLGDDDKHAMSKLTKAFGENFWEYAVFVLTFANQEDCYRTDERDADTGPDPDDYDKKAWDALRIQRFKGRLKIWEKELNSFLTKEVEVKPEIANKIPVVPTGDHLPTPNNPYPNHLLDRDDWFKKFWEACCLRVKSIQLFLKVNENRLVAKDDGTNDQGPAANDHDEGTKKTWTGYIGRPSFLRRELIEKLDGRASDHEISNESEVTKLEKSMAILKEENVNLIKKNENLVTSIEAMEELFKEKHQFYRQDQEENLQLQEENQRLQGEYQQLQGKYQQLQREYQQLQEKLKELPKVLAKEKSWKISHKDVKMTKQELGRGGWGVIWVGQFRGQKVAVKQMHELIASEEFLQLLHREIDTMSQLRHPNLVQFIGAVLDDPSGNPLIITEIMDMSLRGAYEKKQLTPVPVDIPLAVMRDVAVGLNYLHCLPDPIIHRDVSSANVLLESKGHGRWKTKISDFGSAKFACAAVTKAVGAILYSAPEAFQSILDSHDPLTPKMDVFSYGVLLCEVLTCQFPDQQAFKAMLEQVRSQHHSYVYDLIQSCIKRNPQDRPDMDQVIQQLDTI